MDSFVAEKVQQARTKKAIALQFDGVRLFFHIRSGRNFAGDISLLGIQCDYFVFG